MSAAPAGPAINTRPNSQPGGVSIDQRQQTQSTPPRLARCKTADGGREVSKCWFAASTSSIPSSVVTNSPRGRARRGGTREPTHRHRSFYSRLHRCTRTPHRPPVGGRWPIFGRDPSSPADPRSIHLPLLLNTAYASCMRAGEAGTITAQQCISSSRRDSFHWPLVPDRDKYLRLALHLIDVLLTICFFSVLRFCRI